MLEVQYLESRDVPSTVFTLSDMLRAHDESGKLIWSAQPYETWRGEIHLSSGDVNGDGVPDAILGAGFGGGPHVRVLDGLNGSELASFYAYDPDFTGGVYVGFSAMGNLARPVVNSDRPCNENCVERLSGQPQELKALSGTIWTGAGPGGGPHVKEFNLSPIRETRSFFAGPADYTGGVRVSSASDAYSGGVDIDQLASGNRGFKSRTSAKISIYLGFGADAPAELIPGIYQQVANAFEPFNVNITTVQPTGPANTWATVVVGGNSSRFAQGDLTDSARGVAIVNGFYQSNAFEGSIAHVFADRIGWGNPVMIGRAIAHEAAHLFGVGHSSDPASIMFEGLNTGEGRFDPLSVAILTQRLGVA